MNIDPKVDPRIILFLSGAKRKKAIKDFCENANDRQRAIIFHMSGSYMTDDDHRLTQKEEQQIVKSIADADVFSNYSDFCSSARDCFFKLYATHENACKIINHIDKYVGLWCEYEREAETFQEFLWSSDDNEWNNDSGRKVLATLEERLNSGVDKDEEGNPLVTFSIDRNKRSISIETSTIRRCIEQSFPVYKEAIATIKCFGAVIETLRDDDEKRFGGELNLIFDKVFDAMIDNFAKRDMENNPKFSKSVRDEMHKRGDHSYDGYPTIPIGDDAEANIGLINSITDMFKTWQSLIM